MNEQPPDFLNSSEKKETPKRYFSIKVQIDGPGVKVVPRMKFFEAEDETDAMRQMKVIIGEEKGIPEERMEDIEEHLRRAEVKLLWEEIGYAYYLKMIKAEEKERKDNE